MSVFDELPPPPPEDDHYTSSGDNVTPLRRPDHDPQAERALLATVLAHPETLDTVLDRLDSDDFHDPRHELIWEAIEHVLTTDGIIPDPVTVLERLTTTGNMPKVVALWADLAAPSTTDIPVNPINATTYARTIRDHALRRRALTDLRRAEQIVETSTPDQYGAIADGLYDTGDRISHHAAGGGSIGGRPATPTIDDLLADPDDEPDWIIPGLLEHQDRVILTAEEGAGKSTLLRQIAITTAAGIHPFTHEPIKPIHVLHVDVENTTRQSKRRYRPLRIQAGHRLNPQNLHIEIRTGGLDLTTPADVTWLTQLCGHLKPDLLLIGPIYKLANGDPTEEKSAKPVAMAIDKIRELYDLAVILEAHAAKASNGQKKRPHEPYGWSGWMRWPEFGLWLDKDGSLSHWRGAREERTWPTHLQRGGQWPWTPALESADHMWADVRTARLKAGRPVSLRDLEKTTGLSKSTLARLVGKGGQFEQIWTPFNQNQHPQDEPR